MQKSNQIGYIIAGAAAALVLYKYSQMSKVEKKEFFSDLKDKTLKFLENSEKTVEKVQHYAAQIKEKEPEEWIDKLYLLRKMFIECFGKKPVTSATVLAAANN